MIRVLAVYPNSAGSRFDADYYLNRHTPFAQALLGPHGLTAIRTTIGIVGLDGGPPPYWSSSELIFTSRDAFDAAMSSCGAELFSDVANYTDSQPILQLCELHDPSPAT